MCHQVYTHIAIVRVGANYKLHTTCEAQKRHGGDDGHCNRTGSTRKLASSLTNPETFLAARRSGLFSHAGILVKTP